MKPISLKLKGFRGILAGLGLTELFIDLSTVASASLIAITGGNGSGKTTVMDNLHPFRLQPYKLRRAKDYTPAAFSYYDQCFGHDALKELVWEHGGNTYRSTIMIDCDKRKTESYLSRLVDGKWTPLNDGKVATYDDALASVLCTPRLFFTGPYRAQGAKSLSDYTRGEMLAVIGELLELNRITEVGTASGEVVKILEKQLDAKRAVVEELSDSLLSKATPPDVVPLQTETVFAAQREEEAKVMVTTSRKALEDGRVEAARFEEARKTAGDKQRDLDETTGAKNAILKEIVGLENLFAHYQSDNSNRVASLTTRRDAKETAVRLARSASDEIARLEGQLATLGEEVNTGDLKESVAQSVRAKDKIVLIHHEAEALRSKLAKAVSERESRRITHKKELSHCGVLASTLGGLDCAGKGNGWVNESCKLLTAAIEARNKIPALEAVVISLETPLDEEVELQTAIAAKEEQVTTVQAIADDHRTRQEAFEKAERNNSTIRTQHEMIRRTLPALRQRLEALPELEQELATLTSELETLAAEMVEHKTTFTTNVTAKREAALTLDTKVVRLTDEIERIRASGSIDIAGLETALAEAERSLESASRQHVEAKAKLEVARRDIEQDRMFREDIATRIDVAKRQHDRITTVLADLNTLAKAFSNAGIVSLEVEDSGPAISALANELLASCYGPRYSVRMITVADKVDGGQKDVFDIVVFDSETNSAVSMTEKSGGQITWIEDAITRAICLFQIGKSNVAFEAIFSDEKDGALDPERKHEFFAVKRRAMQLGGHKQEFFITQTAELAELADARIVLAGNKVTIQGR